MKKRLMWDAFGQRGAVVSSQKGGNDRKRSGAVRTQAGGSGQAKRSETKGGVLIALYLHTCEVYIRCSAQGNCMARTNAERGCARPREDSECCGARPSDALELHDRCRNVGAMLLLALDLLPNVARIGTLQRVGLN